MRRTLFDAEHERFRDTFREFFKEYVVLGRNDPNDDAYANRSLWQEAGKRGFLGMVVPASFGGDGIDDFRYNMVINEECSRSPKFGLGLVQHNDVVGPYLLQLSTEEQRQRWLPGYYSGDIITALAAGETAGEFRAEAVDTEAEWDGHGWVLNGTKRSVINGLDCDLVIVVARTGRKDSQNDRELTLLVVEADAPGFCRAPVERADDPIGVADLSFADVRIPESNMLGLCGQGQNYLGRNNSRERLSVAVRKTAAMERHLEEIRSHLSGRDGFETVRDSEQELNSTLVELGCRTACVRNMVDSLVSDLLEGRLTPEAAALVEWWSVDEHLKLVECCNDALSAAGSVPLIPSVERFPRPSFGESRSRIPEILFGVFGRG